MAPRIFFCFNISIIIYSFKYETIETHARSFLPLNISVVGSVFNYVKFIPAVSYETLHNMIHIVNLAPM
jgi:hypothetical protein